MEQGGCASSIRPFRVLAPALALSLSLPLLLASVASAEPVEIDRVDAPCCPVDLARLGDHLVVAYDDPTDLVGLRVYDYTDPTAPQLVSSVPLDVTPERIAPASPGFVYVVARGDGMRIVDLQTPASPAVVGSLPIVGDARRVEVRGNRAYVGTRADGLHIYDVSTAQSPALITTFGDDGRRLIDFDVGGTLVGSCVVLAGASESSWRVHDFADPLAPLLVGSHEGWGYPFELDCSMVSSTDTDFFVHGPWFYHQPSQGGNFDTHAILKFEPGRYSEPDVFSVLDIYEPLDGLTSLGSRFFAMNSGRLRIEETDLAQGVGTLGFPTVWPGSDPGQSLATRDPAWQQSRPFEMHAEDGLLFSTAGAVDVVAWDVSDPASPQVMSWLRPDGDLARRVELAGDALVVEDQIQGLRVFDVSDPSQLTPVATLSGLRGPMVAAGSLLYIGTAEPPWGVQVVDLSTPASPVLLGFVEFTTPPEYAEFPHQVADIALDGTTLVAIVTISGVHVIDVTSPLAPVEQGVLEDVFQPWTTLDVEGGVAVVTRPGDYSPWYPPYGRAAVIDLSSPAAPVEASTLIGDAYVRQVHVTGGHAFVFVGNTMSVYDLTTPSAPVFVTSLSGAGQWLWVADGEVERDGDRLLLPLAGHGLKVFDIADPAAPGSVGHWLTTSNVESLAIGDGVLFTAEGLDGVAAHATDGSAVPLAAPPALALLVALIFAQARRALRRR